MIRGSIVALVTPMDESGAVNYGQLAELVDFHVANGTDAIVSMGTTGESATFDEAEHCAVMRRTVELAAGHIPVIAGTGANSTREALDLTRCAKESGADACLLVTPYYNKPTQEGLYLHHKAVAEAVDIPQILYNVPGRTACDMVPETVARLAELERIVGIKEATGDISRIRRIREENGKGFVIYSGDDCTAMEAILAGADGVISVTANAVPRAMHELCARALDGDRQRAEAINGPLDPLHDAMFVESNPIPVKWALQEMGLITPGIRLPLTELSAEHHATMRRALQQANVL